MSPWCGWGYGCRIERLGISASEVGTDYGTAAAAAAAAATTTNKTNETNNNKNYYFIFF